MKHGKLWPSTRFDRDTLQPNSNRPLFLPKRKKLYSRSVERQIKLTPSNLVDSPVRSFDASPKSLQKEPLVPRGLREFRSPTRNRNASVNKPTYLAARQVPRKNFYLVKPADRMEQLIKNEQALEHSISLLSMKHRLRRKKSEEQERKEIQMWLGQISDLVNNIRRHVVKNKKQ